MAKKIRNVAGQKVRDLSTIGNNVYNEAAGAEKNTDVGRHLKPLQTNATTWSTDASTVVKLPSQGRNLAIYNSDTVVHAVTLGDTTYPPTAQAAGAVQAATNGQNVGIPCPAGQWTYIACGDQDQVITDSNTLLVFLIDDDTFIRQEASK